MLSGSLYCEFQMMNRVLPAMGRCAIVMPLVSLQCTEFLYVR